MLRAEINNRLFIQKTPRKWTWNEDAGVAVVLWEDGDSFAFIAGRELTDVAYAVPDLLAIDNLEGELEKAGVPIKSIYKTVLSAGFPCAPIETCDDMSDFDDEDEYDWDTMF